MQPLRHTAARHRAGGAAAALAVAVAVALPVTGAAPAAAADEPSASIAGPILLAATAVRLPLALTEVPRGYGLDVRATTADGAVTTTRVALAPDATGVTVPGLVRNRTYSFSVALVTPGLTVGAFSAPRRAVTTAPPVFDVTEPTSSSAQVPGRFPLVLSRTNVPSTRYTINAGIDGAASQRFATDATGRFLVFPETGTQDPPFSAPPGSTVRFAGVARDVFGNSTAYVVGRKAAVIPFDDGVGTYTGAVRAARKGSYGGTSMVLSGAGATATMTWTGSTFQLVNDVCPTCGQVQVRLDDQPPVLVDAFAETRVPRQVLLQLRQLPVGTHTVTITNVAPKGRPFFVVDGYAIRN